MKLLLTIFTIGFLASYSFSQNINTTKIDDYINHIVKNNQDVGDVSIFKDGKEIYNRSFGQKNIFNLQFDENTKYHIGSITKLFTATLIWKLIEQNKLKPEDKLANFYPDLPNADKITIKNLLEHSSGMDSYVTKQDSLYYWLKKPVKQQEILKEIKRQGTLFTPGDSVAYSNTGYYVLTMIVENKYGDSYDEVVNNEIIKPLNLSNTYSIKSNPKNVYASYEYVNGKWKEIDDFYYENVIGVGDMVSTPRDLNKFIYQLLNYKILKKETIEKMKPIIPEEDFGRGLQYIPFYEYASLGHGGATYGTFSEVAYEPESGISVSYSINAQQYIANDFIIGVYNIIHDLDFDYPNFNITKIDPVILNKYVGTYSAPDFPMKLTISENDSILNARASGQPIFKLTPNGKNKFTNEVTEIEITFKPEQKLLILYQDEKQYEMKREE